jgi:Stage II sporulation protein E (SpoIIE)
VIDGVVEARAKGGELFGFERTQEVSGEGAKRIVRAAEEFGQDDDITVVTLCPVGAVGLAMESADPVMGAEALI